MNVLNNEFKTIDVPGLKKLTYELGFSYVSTIEGRLFIGGG